MKDTFIVVPFYNEDFKVLETCILDLLVYFENIVLVNDGGSREYLKKLEHLPVHYLRHEINLGQGAALQTGMEYALSQGANIIAHFDADGQHDPQDVIKMIQLLRHEDLAIVIGSRFMEKEHAGLIPWPRKILIKTGILINFLFTGLWMSDAHHGLRVLHRKMAIHLDFKENRQLHATEILSVIKKNKFSYKEYPARVSYSAYSISKGQKNIQFVKVLKDLILSKFIK